MVTLPVSSCRSASILPRMRIGLAAGPPYMPECRSRLAALMVISSPTRPRSEAQIDGVSASNMSVSHTSAKSAFSSSRLASRKGFSDGDPLSSSPSNRMLIRQGSWPCSAFQARQASTNSISCPLSSEEPRPVIDFAAGLDFPHLRQEGRGLPELDRVDRLDVIVPIEEHMRAVRRGAWMMRDDHRMAGCLPQTGVEADRLQIVDQPFRGLPAFRRIGRVCRYGLDPQQREQALKAVVEMFVETVEDGRKCGHCGLCFATAGPVSYNKAASKETAPAADSVRPLPWLPVGHRRGARVAPAR